MKLFKKKFFNIFLICSFLGIILFKDRLTLNAAGSFSFDIPVYVVLSSGSNIPAEGTVFNFQIQSEDNAPLPAVTTLSVPSPTATGETNKTTASFHVSTNTYGSFSYIIKETTRSLNGYTTDIGSWITTVHLDSSGNVTSRSWAYAESIADMTNTSSFDIIKHFTTGTYPTAASVSISNGSTTLKLGGDKVISTQSDTKRDFNTAIIKSHFTIDFTKDFEIKGKFTSALAPDGSYVGFVPATNANPASDNLVSGGGLAIYGTTYAKNAILLEFDSYDNTSNNGDSGIGGLHFALMKMDSNGQASVVSNQYCKYTTWPTGQGTYSITNNATTKVLTFIYKASDGTTQTWTYSNPTAQLGNTAKLVLGGSIRRAGSNNGVGSIGATAAKTEISFDTFRYTGNRTGYSTKGVFVNDYKCPHTSWNYSRADHTLYAKCKGCLDDCPTYPDPIGITLVPNTDSTNSDGLPLWTTKQNVSFSITDSDDWIRILGANSLPTIKYEGRTDTVYASSSISPISAGTYNATISKNMTTLSIPFEIKQVHEITFHSNGGGSSSIDSIIVDPGTYTLPPVPFKAPLNHDSNGWAYSATGDPISTSTINVNHDINLYAKWIYHRHFFVETNLNADTVKKSCYCGFYLIQYK